MVEVHRDRWVVVVDKASGEDSEKLPIDAALHHRLDRPASGLLILAAHPDANAGLARAFREHTARRTYRAVLDGTAAPGTWDWALDGKRARTQLDVEGAGAGLTAARITLQTGRTHQIRRHAAMAGHPVVGDRRYGGDVGRAWPRLALHAWRLELAHPVTGEPLAFEAPIPDDLRALWALVTGSS